MKFFRRTWAFLFVALLLQLIFNPCLESEFGRSGAYILLTINTLVVVAIVHKLALGRIRLAIALFLAIPTLILFWVPSTPPLDLILYFFNGALYLYAALSLLPFLLRARQVTVDELFGAASLYILIGLSWALLYQILETLTPGSFHIADVHNLDGVLSFSDFSYFSFVTLTTLGYGDVAPVTCQARSLAILEAISGILTLGVVVARLISLYSSQILQEDNNS